MDKKTSLWILIGLILLAVLMNFIPGINRFAYVPIIIALAKIVFQNFKDRRDL